MKEPEVVLATLEEAAQALARLRASLAGEQPSAEPDAPAEAVDVAPEQPVPAPGPDAAPPPRHWQEREPGED